MKVSPYVVAAALLLSGAAATLRAEAGEGKKTRWSHEGRHERMKEALGLDSKQLDSLKTLRRARRDASSALGAKLKASLVKLRDQLEDKASDKELASTLDSIASTRKALAAEREKFESGLAAILTPSQRARLIARVGHGRGMTGMKRRQGRGRGPQREPRED